MNSAMMPSATDAGACVCCGAQRWQALRTDWAVHKCGRCGHVSALDPFAAAKVEPLYGEDFATGHVHPTYVFENGQCRLRDGVLWQQRLRWMEAYRGAGRLLGVGCSVGMLLDFARGLGWQPQGIESSPWECDYARDHFGLPIHQGMLEAGVFADGSFDAVLCSHTLEHVPAPDLLLQQFRRVLRPGGGVLIVVPTQFASPTYRLFSQTVGEPPPRHVQFFTASSLPRLLRAQGFRVEHVAMNLQLAYLGRLAFGRGAGRAIERTSERVNNAQSGAAAAGLTRTAKAAANWLAGLGGFCDELAVVARRL